jgi:hypothetical protein
MLSDIYDRWRTRGATEIAQIAEAFHPPLLVQLPDEWVDAHHRIAYIGQETGGWSWTMAEATGLGYTWGYNDLSTLLDFVNYGGSVTALLDGYRQFDFAVHQPVTIEARSGATSGGLGSFGTKRRLGERDLVQCDPLCFEFGGRIHTLVGFRS